MVPATVPRWRDFLAIGVASATLVFGILSLLVPLLLLGLLLAVLVAGSVLRRQPSPLCLLGAGAGIGVPLLVVAWLNRFGPGTHCSTHGSSRECTDLWNPWPWLAFGLVAVASAVGAFARQRRRQHA